ncbi:MAG: HlyD family efflux transporter periplasmic adaptor subunit [Planctomycetota bacterium]|nr:HlyD family efflux transporter periplasmic adaptor subunit [Planctomycetota bacterium]
MATSFSRTLRSLDQQRPKPWLLLSLVFALVVWACWLILARVPVYEVTQHARLEVTRAAHPLAASVSGRIVRSQLQLGRRVAEGDVLVELDATEAELAVSEKQTRIASLAARLTALEKEIVSERETLDAQKQARLESTEELTAQIERTQLQAKFAGAQAARAKQLRTSDSISESEAEKMLVDAEMTAAALTEAKAAIKRSDRDRLALENARQTQIIRLERESVQLRGDMDNERAAIRRLERDLTECQLRAPVAGRIGEVAELRVGSVVQVAQKLCAVVPDGSPRAIARFQPVVVGRLKPGQSARLRLDGFPWTQYGTLPATVTGIDTEPHDGLIRVELSLSPRPTSKIPLDHGLTGSVEIEVERVSPVSLLLRAAGQFLGTRKSTAILHGGPNEP